MKSTVEHDVLGQTVRLTVEITGMGTISTAAAQAIQLVLARECERFAQIAGVDIRDQAQAIDEAARLRSLPPGERPPATVLTAGFKGAP